MNLSKVFILLFYNKINYNSYIFAKLFNSYLRNNLINLTKILRLYYNLTTVVT